MEKDWKRGVLSDGRVRKVWGVSKEYEWHVLRKVKKTHFKNRKDVLNLRKSRSSFGFDSDSFRTETPLSQVERYYLTVIKV